MKKIVSLFALSWSISIQANAQNAAEWLQQKRTQKRYLLEQILASAVYQDYLKNGYQVLHNGLMLIGNWRIAELDLHRSFYDAAAQGLRGGIPPDRIARFNRLLGAQRDQLASLSQLCRSGSWVNPQEQRYVWGLLGRIPQQLAPYGATFQELSRAGARALNDAQRLTAIDSLLNEFQADLSVLAHFHSELRVLLRQRMAEQQDARRVGILHQRGGQRP